MPPLPLPITLPLLLLLSASTLPALTAASSPPPEQAPLIPSADLASLSSLFLAQPAPTAGPPLLCCGPTCAPGACNAFLASPHSAANFANLYPLPTTTPPTPTSKLSFPCCGPTCPDGACRGPGAVQSSRPAPAPETTAPPPSEGGRLRPGHGDGENVGVVIGCCKGCKGCRQSAGGGGEDSTEVVRARPTGGAAGAGEGEGAAVPPKKPEDPGFQPPRPAPEAGICIGCVGGVCWPCIQSRVATFVGFTPEVGGGDEATATATATGEGAGQTAVAPGEHAEPTMLLAADYVDAINGVNQDVVPVVVQSFGVGVGEDGTGEGKGNEWELLTLLANVDLKVQENYISRRVLVALGLVDDVKAFKKGTGKVAVLSGLLEPMVVDGYVDVDIVIGSATGGEENGLWQLLKGLRWNVYGEDKEGVLGTPDVVLGTRVLGEIGGLSAVQGFRRQVEAGVKVLGVGHFVGDSTPEKTPGKDEL